MSKPRDKNWRPEELFIERALTKIASEQNRDVQDLSTKYYTQELGMNGEAFDYMVHQCISKLSGIPSVSNQIHPGITKISYGNPSINKGVPDLSFLNGNHLGNGDAKTLLSSEMREELKALVMWWFQQERETKRHTISPQDVNFIEISDTFAPILILVNSTPKNQNQTIGVHLDLPTLRSKVLDGVRLQLSDTRLCAKRDGTQLYKFGGYAFVVVIVGGLVYWVAATPKHSPHMRLQGPMG